MKNLLNKQLETISPSVNSFISVELGDSGKEFILGEDIPSLKKHLENNLKTSQQEIIDKVIEMVEGRLNKLMRNPGEEDDVAIQTLQDLILSLKEL